MTSAVRAAGLPVANVRPLLGAMERLGMPLYGCLTPDGYKNTEEAWLSADATMQRISFATALARGALPVTQIGGAIEVGRLEAILAPAMAAGTRDAIKGAPPPLRAALILGSPDFMRR